MTAAIIDRVPRYAPKKVLCNNRIASVLQYNAYPPGNHPKGCPIVPRLTALELRTEFGSRWFGFEKVFINSELRMVVSGFAAADYVRSRWEKVPSTCLP
jgi:hypothetical protein